MPTSHVIWQGFRSGELTPRLDGNINFEKYYQGCKALENFIPTLQGPAHNRPGFRYIASAKYSDRKCRLIPFEFSTEQAYILEFGHQYIRFFMNQGQIMSAGVPYEIATPYTESELPELQFVQSADMLFIVHPNHFPKRLSRTGHTSWILEDIPFIKRYFPSVGMLKGDFDTYSLGIEKVKNGSFDADVNWAKGAGWAISGGVASKVATTTETLSQNTDEVAGETYKVTYRLTKTAGTGITVSIGDVSGTQRTTDGLYTEYITATGGGDLTFTPTSDFEGTIDDVSVKKATLQGYEYCIDNDLGTVGYNNDTDGVGSYLEIDAGSGKTIELLKIILEISKSALSAVYDVEYFDDTWKKAVTGWNLSDKGLGPAEKGWASVGAWQRWRLYKANAAQAGGDVTEVEFYIKGNPSAWVTGKYPSSITFFEDRLWLAYLQTVWASKSGDYFNLSLGVNDDDAMEYTISSSQVNKIHWLSSGKVLAIGTASDIYKAAASTLHEAITPLNLKIVSEVSFKGADYKEAINIDGISLYLSRTKRQLREFTYSFEDDGYVAPDMTILAEHLFRDSIVSMCYQPEPFCCLWLVRNDGVLLGFTYSRLEKILAWHKHTTDGQFENVAVIYGLNGLYELWAVVKRTIGGTVKRYIELLEDPFDDTTLNSNECFFVDSGLTYNGPPTTTISGLGHLEGKTVAVLATGVVQTSKTVSGGSITLDNAASRVIAGLPYTSTLQTMRVEREDIKGTSQGRKKRINQIVFRLYKAKQFKYGSSPTGEFKEKIFDAMFSGDWEADQVLGFDREGYVCVRVDKPLPATIVALILEVEVN